MTNDRFEMNDELMEQVNGGYSWEDWWRDCTEPAPKKEKKHSNNEPNYWPLVGPGLKEIIDLIPQIF